MVITSEQLQEWFVNCSPLSKGRKKYVAEIAEIEKSTSFLKQASLPQRIWHLIHNTTAVPLCTACTSIVSWDHRHKEYKRFCSNRRCYLNDPTVRAKITQNRNHAHATQNRKTTCLKRYGHTNYLASQIGKETVRRSFDLQTSEQKKFRYDKVVNTRLKTCKRKYGVDNISYLSYVNSSETLTLLNDKIWLQHQHHVCKKSQSQIASELNIKGGATVIGKYLRKNNITILNPLPISIGETEIANWLTSKNINIIRNDRKTIHPYELDILIPEYKLAIEYCGLYWHSEQQGKDRHYHKNKWKLCKEEGIQLLTIYEDEWKTHKIQVKQKILSLLGMDSRQKVYARKCEIVYVDKKQKRDFFNNNHIQGNGPSSINIGLKYNNELIAVMGFIKQKSVFYLNRYATNSQVAGGFSKLLSHFQKKYKWSVIVSFADLRWSVGNLYKQNNWKLDKILPPDYSYSPNGHTRFHKFNYRRKNLNNILSNYNPALSETVNCDNNGILRIWDCGKQRWVLYHSF